MKLCKVSRHGSAGAIGKTTRSGREKYPARKIRHSWKRAGFRVCHADSPFEFLTEGMDCCLDSAPVKSVAEEAPPVAILLSHLRSRRKAHADSCERVLNARALSSFGRVQRIPQKRVFSRRSRNSWIRARRQRRFAEWLPWHFRRRVSGKTGPINPSTNSKM